MKKYIQFVLYILIVVVLLYFGGSLVFKDAQANQDEQIFLDKTVKSIAEEVIIDVPYINQKEKYPTGCESVTAVMALKNLGYDITVEEFIDCYLDKGQTPHYVNSELVGCDPWLQFPGSPYNKSGIGCFASVISKAVKK